MLLKKAFILSIALFLMTGCLKRPEPRTGDFNAQVKDSLSEQPIPGVNINIGGQAKETDLKGQFSLADLAPGDYQIRMTRQWYESKDITYKHLGKPEPVVFYLRPTSLPGRIYYSHDEGKNREIYELFLESRTVRKVLALPDSGETNPAWSMSGRFAVESTANDISKIIVYKFGNGNLTPILIRDGKHPSIDNEGNYVVFKSNSKIVKYDISNNQEIESYDQAGWYPVISPDGTRVAYVSGNYDKLYIFSSKTDYKVFIPNGDYMGYKLSNPCWSPDGGKIVFEAYQDSKGQRGIYWIYVKPDISAEMWKITLPSGPSEQHKHPTWDDSGEIIYFSRSVTYSSKNEIYGVEFEEGQVEQGIERWIMVSKGTGSKDYPCWGK